MRMIWLISTHHHQFQSFKSSVHSSNLCIKYAVTGKILWVWPESPEIHREGHTVLLCTVLNCTVLYCITLYFNVLYCIELYNVHCTLNNKWVSYNTPSIPHPFLLKSEPFVVFLQHVEKISTIQSKKPPVWKSHPSHLVNCNSPFEKRRKKCIHTNFAEPWFNSVSIPI